MDFDSIRRAANRATLGPTQRRINELLEGKHLTSLRDAIDTLNENISQLQLRANATISGDNITLGDDEFVEVELKSRGPFLSGFWATVSWKDNSSGRMRLKHETVKVFQERKLAHPGATYMFDYSTRGVEELAVTIFKIAELAAAQRGILLTPHRSVSGVGVVQDKTHNR